MNFMVEFEKDLDTFDYAEVQAKGVNSFLIFVEETQTWYTPVWCRRRPNGDIDGLEGWTPV